MIFSLEHRLTRYGVRRRHTVVGACGNIVGVAVLTKLTFFHLGVVQDLEHPGHLEQITAGAICNNETILSFLHFPSKVLRPYEPL